MKKLLAVLIALALVSGVVTVMAVSSPRQEVVPPNGLKASVAMAEDIWYPDNTVGVAGYSLRDMYPELTDKWYNVVPVDLTREGTQTFRLVASNMYYIGDVTVTISGDDVTVAYALADGRYFLKNEAMQWFLAWEDITADFLSNPAGDVAFGQTVSRAADLEGQEVALLFVCNRVTYRQPYFTDGDSLQRYWPNATDWVNYRNALQPLLDMVPVTHPAPPATETDLEDVATATDLEGEATATDLEIEASATDLAE